MEDCRQLREIFRITLQGKIMATYEELKSELEIISKVVDRFPEIIKPRVFELLVEAFTGHVKVADTLNTPPQNRPSTKTRKKAKSTAVAPKENGNPLEKTTPKRAISTSYQLDREINLRGDKSIPSFKAFVEEKKPNSAKEFNTIAAYYLQKLLGSTKVTLDQCYTCYKEVSRRPPEAFRQSFTDTKNKEGWVEFDSEGNVRVTHRGTIFVEHDLPSVAESKKKNK